MARIYLHTAYERLWHWWQAAVICLLLFTGLELHLPGRMHVLGFSRAGALHDFAALLLVLNAALGLIYELSSGRIKSYFPEPRDFTLLAAKQAMYYVRGIFKREPHPIAKSGEKRLNPLQQLTYLAILNVLLPTQMLTGFLMWGAERWPGMLEPVGGLGPIALVHTLAAWLFAAFILVHVYLTTTAGAGWLDGIKGMITGYEELHEEEERSPSP